MLKAVCGSFHSAVAVRRPSTLSSPSPSPADMNELYSHLASDSVRLLELLDDTGTICNLATFTLREAPPFVALSYVWGKATYQKRRSLDLEYVITLNGRKVLVQQNLYDAITTLAKDIRLWQSGGHRLWVDFICINQSDKEERGRQVGLMKEIYEKSGVVFAWLGQPFDEEETELAIKLMRSFNEDLRVGLETSNHAIDPVMGEISSSHAGFPLIKGSDSWKAWMGIAEMMNNRYWSRTWIYQEATTPGPIWFYCGNKRFNDIHLSATSAFGTRFSRSPNFDSHFSTAVGFASNMSRLNLARIKREDGRPRRLVNLLSQVRNTDCSDARDKIYAQLGHAIGVESDKLAVDYAKDIKTVYGDLVRANMSVDTHTGLQLLEYVCTPAPDASNKYLKEVIDPSWPSWIPDWRQRVTLGPFYPHDEDQSYFFDPCPGSEAEVGFSNDVMSIRGFTLGDAKITQLTQICENWRDVSGPTERWLAEMNVVDSPRISDEVFGRCLVADVSAAKSDGGGRRYHTRSHTVERDKIHIDDSVFARISVVCLGRRMGRTSHGAFGIFPAAAQHGDIVSVFHGGHILYLLRPIPNSEDHFRYIGPCYVDGLMDGKAVQHSTRPQMLHLV